MWFRDLGVLIYIDLLKFKNGVKYSFTNPLKALRTVYSFLMPILFIILPSIINKRVTIKNIKTFLDYETLTNIRGVITIVLILFIAISFRVFSGKYVIGGFKITDVQYLFPSPISERTLLFYSMIRSMITDIIVYLYGWLILAITILKNTVININNIIVSFIGVMFLMIIYKSLSYFIYSIKIRFNTHKIIGYLGKIILTISLVYTGYIVYKLYLLNFNFNELFIEHVIGKIPIISEFEKIMTLPILEENVIPYFSLICIILTSIIIIILFLIFSVNYYEDVAENLDGLTEKIKTNEEYLKDTTKSADKNYKNIKNNVSSKDKIGEGAFVWKNNILDKKKNMFKKRIIIGVITILLGAITTKFIYTFTGLYDMVLMLGLFMCFFQDTYKTTELLKSELKSMYIYLLPGKITKKLLAVMIKPGLLSILYRTLFFIPMLLFLPINKFYILITIISIDIFVIMTMFKNIMIRLLMPKDDEGGGFITQLISIVLKAIPIGITAYILVEMKAYFLAVSIFIILTLIEIILLKIICEKLFEKIEYE